MKVILTKDVKAQGKRGDVINVSDGYANNFLLKNGLAVPASSGNIVINNQQKAVEAKHRAEQKAEAEALAKVISQTEITISASVGANGKIFGSVTNKEIEDALAKQDLIVDRKKIILDSPIKSLGNYVVNVKLHPEVAAKLRVNVVAQ
ncbi:MAG: 50S ribosomal protein L9 [Clostridia bacterium]|nr:50S ribosomal protein L9 [Clostridia bacterium]